MPFRFSGKDKGQKGESGIFRRNKKETKEANSSFKNVFKNAFGPFSGGKQLKGSISHVALEVAVTKILRKVMKADSKSLIDLAIIHTISLPLLGGLSAALSSANKTNGYGAKKMSAHVKEGLKQVPAVYLAQFIYNIYCHGFETNFMTMKDALIMAAGKLLTRPIAAQLYKRNKFMQNAFDSVALIQQLQQSNSNFSKVAESRYDDSVWPETPES